MDAEAFLRTKTEARSSFRVQKNGVAGECHVGFKEISQYSPKMMKEIATAPAHKGQGAEADDGCPCCGCLLRRGSYFPSLN